MKFTVTDYPTIRRDHESTRRSVPPAATGLVIGGILFVAGLVAWFAGLWWGVGLLLYALGLGITLAVLGANDYDAEDRRPGAKP